MDMHMPVMDGLEASAKIIELGAGVPIVAMTANIMSGDIEIYKQSGMSDCVGKPFTSQELWRCLLKYLKPVSRSSAAGKNLQADIDYDLEFKKSLQKTFFRSNQEKFKEITEALENNDIKLAHRLVHSLKGNAGQLGISALQNAAANVERNLKDGKNLASAEQLSLLKKELDAALSQLAVKAALSGEGRAGQAHAQTKSKSSPQELFDKLEPLLVRGNPDCCGLVDSLRAVKGSETLIQQIEDYEFESALASLGDLKKNILTKKLEQ